MNLKKCSRLAFASWFSVASALAALAGCSKSVPAAGRLPDVNTFGSCIEVYPAPNGCEWALSMDAIVFGTIERIRPLSLPAVIPDNAGHWVWVDSCDGAIDIALELTVSVERTLFGEADGTVTVRIGQEQVGSYSPMPERSGDRVIWTRGGVPVEGGLAKGQKIGLPLHWMATDGLWSLMGEIMFEVKVDEVGKEVIAFQSVDGDCRPRVPDGVAKLSLDEFAALAGACTAQDAQAAQERRSAMITMWGTRPEAYMAPVCVPLDGQQDGAPNGCSADSQCKTNEYCDLTVRKCRCLPQCSGKCGGPDGCGSECADTCPSGQTCQAPQYTTCS